MEEVRYEPWIASVAFSMVVLSVMLEFAAAAAAAVFFPTKRLRGSFVGAGTESGTRSGVPVEGIGNVCEAVGGANRGVSCSFYS